ncbi:hypothetical protein [Streptomyces sp. G45]|uniref:hypothetical protein n=1 Tax=Streptomyces sp. G45 TaxID=3406627 RepID=UPI003C15408E
MGSDGRRSVPRAQSEPVCPSCGRPVGTAIKRRKVLGAYVPVWGPAPCRNPQCDACVTEEPEEKAGPGRGFKSKRRRGHRPEGGIPAEGRAEGSESADSETARVTSEGAKAEGTEAEGAEAKEAKEAKGVQGPGPGEGG